MNHGTKTVADAIVVDKKTDNNVVVVVTVMHSTGILMAMATVMVVVMVNRTARMLMRISPCSRA